MKFAKVSKRVSVYSELNRNNTLNNFIIFSVPIIQVTIIFDSEARFTCRDLPSVLFNYSWYIVLFRETNSQRCNDIKGGYHCISLHNSSSNSVCILFWALLAGLVMKPAL